MRLALLVALVLVAGCDIFSDVDPPEREPLAPATYAVTFQATWSAATHPEGFPPDPHFSRLTGATHALEVSLWRLGAVASDGVRAMAETGSTAGLRAESEALGEVASYLEGNPLRPSPGTAGARLTVTDARPAATVVSMLAPSPDWFVGVDGLDLRDGDGWADRVVVDAVVYDAGTDDGASYTAANAPRATRAPVADVAYAPLAGTVVGRLVFERQ